MNRLLRGALLACAALLCAGTVQAQMTIQLGGEARGIVAIPTGDFGQRVNVGTGVAIHGFLLPIPDYGLYGGYSRTTFDLDREEGGSAVDSGWAIGITAAYPIISPVVTPWLRTGVLFHDLEVRGAPTAEGSSSMGWEAHGGLSIAILPRVRLVPGIGYRTYTAPFLDRSEARISYVVPTLAVTLDLR